MVLHMPPTPNFSPKYPCHLFNDFESCTAMLQHFVDAFSALISSFVHFGAIHKCLTSVWMPLVCYSWVWHE